MKYSSSGVAEMGGPLEVLRPYVHLVCPLQDAQAVTSFNSSTSIILKQNAVLTKFGNTEYVWISFFGYLQEHRNTDWVCTLFLFSMLEV